MSSSHKRWQRGQGKNSAVGNSKTHELSAVGKILVYENTSCLYNSLALTFPAGHYCQWNFIEGKWEGRNVLPLLNRPPPSFFTSSFDK